ncbi:MAG: hypothetical protein IJ379_00930 [Lachnospiraceae bacterium]|nr:hypothetical protein [Lachnospiraceae bacterium]
MKKYKAQMITLIVVILMELLLVNWNTNTFLMDREPKETSIEDSWQYIGQRVTAPLNMITGMEQLSAQSEAEAFFVAPVQLEPTGIYKLLDDQYEGITGVGKTHNIFPREMFTKNTFLVKMYRGMYGQFYTATFADNSKILVFIGCNEESAIKEKDYKNLAAQYEKGNVTQTSTADYFNEVSEELQNLQNSMDMEGYIDMTDAAWAKRHDFGLFMMNMLKLLIACLAATIVLIIDKDLTEKKSKKSC